MVTRSLALVVLLLFSAPTFAEEPVRVTMLELQGMVSKQRWAEALLRVQDIVVGQRDESWKKLVTRVAIGHLSQLAAEASPGRDLVAVELGRRYPFLTRSTDFMRRRNDAIVSGYRDCVALDAKEIYCPARLAERLTDATADSALISRVALEVNELQGIAAAKSFLADQIDRAPSSMKDRLNKDPKLTPLRKN